MIKVKDNVFVISGKNYSYAMLVNNGLLQHLYYGEKLSDQDIPYVLNHGKLFQPDFNNVNWDMSLDTMSQEYGSFARGDFKEPSLISIRCAGDSMMRLRYVKYEIENGAMQIDEMPHVRNADQTLKIYLKDDFSDIEVVLIYIVSDNYDILARHCVIKNNGDNKIKLDRAFSFCVDLPSDSYKLLKLVGRYGLERMVDVSPLTTGITRLQSLRGASSHQTNPFVAILKDDCNEQNGECFGFELCYSGNFALTVEYAKHTPTRIQGGINDLGFQWLLDANKEFITPQVFMCYSNGGIGQLSRSFSDFLRDNVIDKKWAKRSRPILVNNWEATYFNYDNKKLFEIIDEASILGIDTFVLDDGWFGKRDNDCSGLGDWFVNEKKLNGGLRVIIDYCRQKGIKFGLWFEPEMVNEDSDLFRTHPDYAIKKEGVEPCRGRNQLVLDLTRKDIEDYVFNAVSKILSENTISYVKWDMNRSLTEYYSSNLSSDRQGEFAHRYMLGVYSLAKRFTQAFPNVLFEGCSSGGGRFDAGMLYYFPQIWTSDCTDAYERTKIQWGSSIAYPLSSISCHVSASPNHQVLRSTPLSTRGDIASLGATGYELDLTKLSEEEKSQIKQQIVDYKKIEQLVLDGDLYRLTSPFESNFFCMMIVAKDKKSAYLVGERFLAEPSAYPIFIKICGLDENTTYRILETDEIVTGKTLKTIGVSTPIYYDFKSWKLHLIAEQ